MASQPGPSNPRRPAAPTPRPSVSSTADPVLRNTLRYTISAHEYALLHKYILSRSRLLRKRVPTVEKVQRILNGSPQSRTRTASTGETAKSGSSGQGKGKGSGKGKEKEVPEVEAPVLVGGADDYNSRAIRHSLRVFVVTGAAMKLWAIVSQRLAGQKHDPSTATPGQKKRPLYKSPALRLSLSLSTILLLYRLLFRFFTRLRVHLLDPSAAPFRVRNPRTTLTLTSPYAPAVGASLAGLALGIYPSQQLRVSIAIYAMFRALEFGWNFAEEGGHVWGWEKLANGRGERQRARPWWFGSWMLQPLAFGQLLHAVVFDRDCFPTSYGDFIFKHSTAYLHSIPENLPANIKWPAPYEIVDSLAQMARMNWPPFVSPILFPNKEDVLPASLAAIAPLTSGAHPLITSLSCATLHPGDPSCGRTFLTFWLQSFPPTTRFFLLVYSALMLPRLRSLYNFPVTTLNRLLARALRMSTFVTGAVSTAWASICLFQAWLPRGFLPTQRFFLGGFLAGLWAFVERRRGRGVFLYSARVSVDSLWKVGVKRRWWRAMKGGDVWVFVLALMLTGVVYERDARAVREASWRKGISWVRGEGLRDWAADEEEEEDEGQRDTEGRDGAEADERRAADDELAQKLVRGD